MTTRIPHFLGGKLVAGRSGRFGPVFNPATGERTGEVALGSADFISEDVTDTGDSAIEAYYKLLNTGFRPGFAAGTDYPCGISVIGSRLTYAKVGTGAVTYQNWINAIKSGKTVISRNGHDEFLNLTVNGSAGPGDEVKLASAGSVPVTVRTSRTALLPRSFDFPPARSRMSTGISTTRSPSSRRRRSDSTSGAPLV